MRVLKSFEYFEPGTVEEAVQTVLKYGAKAKVLAGGVDLVPSMRRREIQPDYVVSIQNIPGFYYYFAGSTIYDELCDLSTHWLSPFLLCLCPFRCLLYCPFNQYPDRFLSVFGS